MDLLHDLGRGPVALDTAVFIYWIEENPRFLSLMASVFSAVESGRLLAVTSALTLLETLVIPYRARDYRLAGEYTRVLTTGPVRLIEIGLVQLHTAARLRALYKLKTPDALQLAAALTSGCTTFVTNDRGLPAIPGFKMLILERYVP